MSLEESLFTVGFLLYKQYVLFAGLQWSSKVWVNGIVENADQCKSVSDYRCPVLPHRGVWFVFLR